MTRLVAASLIGLWAGAASAGCNGTVAPCQISTGTYHIEVPESVDPAAPLPAVMFLHGAGGAGEVTLSNRAMVTALLARGYAVIAPDGQLREDRSRPGRGWDFHPSRVARRDEPAHLAAVADDAAARHGIDRDRIVLAGFSIGGSMTSYVACKTPDAFAAYAPVAGSFWNPLPDKCAGPVRLLHTHGWVDSTVPLEGRHIRSGITQGDVFASMAIWRQTNGCERRHPDQFGQIGDYQWRRWTTCAPGSALEFVLHPGGHSVPAGWASLALDWFEALEPTSAALAGQ